ncbi:hypothetical protein [Peredibacter starrii]|uniref:Uncharacterized protein n=1 Tax=Peredibacter starrii TaxID=28202 RepID=A0AAX4HQW0_9BACT|nr:hypothetical protein [Peredibacter starrii]WPU65636.1 hypothetical protein SOO65_02630 [Peredibacter starrii]
MGRLSNRLYKIEFGGVGASGLQITRATWGGGVSVPAEDPNGGYLYSNVDFIAPRVWNAVWNDIADYQLLCDKLEYGKCYFDTKDGAKICNERCQMSVIGIASDTFGYGVGRGGNNSEVPIGVAGWVLAYVDQEYECGTPLTNDEFGNLTAMTKQEKMEYPERIVGIYKRKEMENFWGPEGQKIEVKGRHWVKIK